MKACVFDIETSGLDAIGSGTLLCAVIRPLRGKETILRADEFNGELGNDKRLLKAVIDELSKYNLLIGHNVINFDINWLRSRCIYHTMPTLPRRFAYDTFRGFKRVGYKTVPNRLGRPSAGLGHVVDFFGFDQEKTSMFPRAHWATVWKRGAERKKAMDDLVDHCRADVAMTEKIYWELMPIDTSANVKQV